MRTLFTPEARLTAIGAKGARGGTVEDYIAKSGPMLTTSGFTERELARRVEIYGDLAHAWSSYEGTGNGGKLKVRGINSFQLVRQNGRWLVQSILWQAESPARPLPADMLPARSRMPRNNWLIAGGVLSAAASALHLACIVGGGDWYRFFGAGEAMAQAAERGEAYPALLTLAIAAVLAIWAAYAFAGAGLIRRLPLMRTALVAITAIYLLRGAALDPRAHRPGDGRRVQHLVVGDRARLRRGPRHRHVARVAAASHHKGLAA